MIALAVVLVVVDGTRSLADNAPVFTSLGSLWAGLHAPSWAAVQQLVATHLVPLSADGAARAVFATPSWALAAGIGVLALILGRKRRKPVFADPL
ncbi:MAG: hypothetical protein KKH72_09025 [Alphaproteobacteria bacterium]|nr:hypothetical protein [Alphaproteobacteria bacterium]